MRRALSKEVQLLADENPALMEEKCMDFGEDDEEDEAESEEVELDIDGWKANLSQDDKMRLSVLCEHAHNPFGDKDYN